MNTATVKRCPVCDWPLAESIEKGCTLGNCCYRPPWGSEEWRRIQERRAALAEQARAETVLPPPAWTPPVLFTSPPCPNRSTVPCGACEGRGKGPVPLLSRIFWLLAAGWEAFRVRELPCVRCAGCGSLCVSCGDARDLCRCAGVRA